MASTSAAAATVESLEVGAYTVPTDRPESDGTLEWDSTTLVLVEVKAGGATGLGYTYGDVAVRTLIESRLVEVVIGSDPLLPSATWTAMRKALRNVGQQGVGAMAVSAIDIALWDLKAKLLGVSLADLLPRHHARVPVYGSGGFTSYSNGELGDQLGRWIDCGLRAAKIKVGREPARGLDRLRTSRSAVGPNVELMVDANGAYDRKQALDWAQRFAEFGVTYFEEPVSSDDLEGLRLLRDRAPAGMAIAAGENDWGPPECHRSLDAGAVDVLQADVTRCGGITALLAVDGLCKARGVPFSAHCAPAISAHAGCAVETLAHLEYFHDHVAIERRLFDGVLRPEQGHLEPDRSRLGLGLELRRPDAAAFAV